MEEEALLRNAWVGEGAVDSACARMGRGGGVTGL